MTIAVTGGTSSVAGSFLESFVNSKAGLATLANV